jgi:hypothetical protein
VRRMIGRRKKSEKSEDTLRKDIWGWAQLYFHTLFDLESAGEDLCGTGIVVNGQPTGRNAGPTWEFLPTPN